MDMILIRARQLPTTITKNEKFIFTLPTNSTHITTTQIKQKKMFRKHSDFLSPPNSTSWSFRGPHGPCVYDKNTQPIRAQYLLEYCFSWMRSWCDLQIFGVTVEHRNKVVTKYCSFTNACEKVLESPEVTAGYFKFTPRAATIFYSKPPLYQPANNENLISYLLTSCKGPPLSLLTLSQIQTFFKCSPIRICAGNVWCWASPYNRQSKAYVE